MHHESEWGPRPERECGDEVHILGKKVKPVWPFLDGLLKGLGDIELFQYCDIRSQFLSYIPYTYVGLTFDRNLAEVLRIHSNLIVRSEGMTGEDDENSFMKKWQNWANDLQRFANFDRAQETFQRNYCDFLDDIKPVLVSLEDKLKE